MGLLNRSQEPHLEGSQIRMRFLQRGRASIPNDFKERSFLKHLGLSCKILLLQD